MKEDKIMHDVEISGDMKVSEDEADRFMEEFKSFCVRLKEKDIPFVASLTIPISQEDENSSLLNRIFSNYSNEDTIIGVFSLLSDSLRQEDHSKEGEEKNLDLQMLGDKNVIEC